MYTSKNSAVHSIKVINFRYFYCSLLNIYHFEIIKQYVQFHFQGLFITVIPIKIHFKQITAKKIQLHTSIYLDPRWTTMRECPKIITPNTKPNIIILEQ